MSIPGWLPYFFTGASMPSRLGIALILAFWLAVVGHVAYRDVLPRYATDAPIVEIDLADEATRSVHARWGIHREGQRIGTIQTMLEPVDADDTFKFISDYQNLSATVLGANVKATKLNIATILHRDGRLAGQEMRAEVTIDYQGIHFAATAVVKGRVVAKQLEGQCTVKSTLLDVDDSLPPTPVPPGPVLSPLQPMNRLKNVHPGQRWVIREVNPLADAMAVLLTKLLKTHGGASFDFSRPKAEFVGEVQSGPVTLAWRGQEIACWIIDYRSDSATARTWVAVKDGKVLRQEATTFGETMRLEREE